MNQTLECFRELAFSEREFGHICVNGRKEQGWGYFNCMCEIGLRYRISREAELDSIFKLHLTSMSRYANMYHISIGPASDMENPFFIGAVITYYGGNRQGLRVTNWKLFNVNPLTRKKEAAIDQLIEYFHSVIYKSVIFGQVPYATDGKYARNWHAGFMRDERECFERASGHALEDVLINSKLLFSEATS